MTQYTNESLFDVISMIANNEIAKLNFDITLICTIVDNSRSSMGWYTVTDGSVRFDAYSEDTKLKNKDSVRVQVPRGDMSGRKYILGKAAAEDTNKPVGYISPSERIVDLTSNLYTSTQEVKLLANSEVTEIQLEEVDVSSKNIDTNIYDTINLGFNIKTQFINTSLSKGNYGVILVVAYESKIQEKSFEYRRYILDSQEFLGNPYSFLLTERQEVLFKIGLPDHRVKEIQLGCYQKNNFSYTDSSGKDILINEDPAEGFYDIILSNFYVSFGNELSKIEDNTVKITTFDDTVYEVGSASAKPKCNITWYNKDENNKYIGFSDGRPIINNNDIDIDNAYSEFEYLELNPYYSDINYMPENFVTAFTDLHFPMDKNGLKIEKEYVEAKNKVDKIAKLRKSILEKMKNAKEKLGEANALDTLTQLVNDFSTVTNNFTNSFTFFTLGGSATSDTPGFEGLGFYWNEAYNKFVSKTNNYFGTGLSVDNATFPWEQFKNALSNVNNDLSYINSLTATNDIQINVINGLKQDVNEYIIEVQKLVSELQVGVFGNAFQGMLDSINIYADSNYLYIDYQEYAANRYNIYWYKANTQEITPDPFGGSGWTRIPELDNKGLPVGKDFTRLGAEAFYTKLPSNVSKQYAEFEFTDGYAAQEKIKAVIVYNHNYYSSNTLEFENKSPIVDKTVLLSIQHGNLSQDMFQIYSDDYQIVNSADAGRDRELKLKVNREDFDWLGATITWTIPTVQTQLVRCDKEMSDKGYSQNNDNKSSFVTYSLTIGENHYQESVLKEQFITFVYKVSGHFSPRNVNNKITCVVELPNRETLTAEKVLNFTAFGTNGSKYNLFFEPLNGYQYPIIPGFNNSINERVLTIAPKLYDADGYEVSFTADAIEVTNISENDENIGYKIDENSGNITFQLKKEQTEYYLVPEISIVVSVLPADTTQTTNPNVQVKLIKQYPIAIGYYYQYEGISKVVYNVLGSAPRYYNQGCYLYDMGTNQRKSYSCELKDLEQDSKDTSLKLITTTDNEQRVEAANMYIKTEKPPKWVLLFKDNFNNIVFCQPIPIMQDNFTSKLLNDWDGGTEVGKDTIMSNLVGAGSKNASGEFSGVLMGEVKRAYEGQGLSLKHGLFGYQRNNLNFQLTVDGVLKLGNNTSPNQMVFDGDKGALIAKNFNLITDNIIMHSNPVLKTKAINSSVSADECYMYVKDNSGDVKFYVTGTEVKLGNWFINAGQLKGVLGAGEGYTELLYGNQIKNATGLNLAWPDSVGNPNNIFHNDSSCAGASQSNMTSASLDVNFNGAYYLDQIFIQPKDEGSRKTGDNIPEDTSIYGRYKITGLNSKKEEVNLGLNDINAIVEGQTYAIHSGAELIGIRIRFLDWYQSENVWASVKYIRIYAKNQDQYWTILSPPGTNNGTGVTATTWVIAAGGVGDNLDSYPFRVSEAGKMYATGAEISGKITATSGKIGDWEIAESRYTNYERIGDYLLSVKDGENNKQFGVMLAPKDIVPQGNTMPPEWAKQWKSWVIAAGEITKLTENNDYCFDQCSFRVDGEGNMYATKGEIGGWTIDGKSLKGPDATYPGYGGGTVKNDKTGVSFKYDPNHTIKIGEQDVISPLITMGNVTIEGDLNLKGQNLNATQVRSQFDVIDFKFTTGTFYTSGTINDFVQQPIQFTFTNDVVQLKDFTGRGLVWIGGQYSSSKNTSIYAGKASIVAFGGGKGDVKDLPKNKENVWNNLAIYSTGAIYLDAEEIYVRAKGTSDTKYWKQIN